MLKNSTKTSVQLWKKLLSLTIALVLVIPTFAMPQPAKAATFKDINRHWAQTYIEKAVSKGLVKGFSDGTFKPDQPVTRAEFTAMANRLLGNSSYESLRFSDVPRNEWYYNDVAKALSAAYVGGYNDGTFKPQNPATRQEASIMISRFLPVAGVNGNVSGFKDASTIANWAIEAVGKVSARGYLSGYADGQFHPNDPITRAMLAKILCDISDKESIVTTNTTVSSNNTTLSNKIYSNGVTVTSSLGSGNATISNCVVLGTLTVNGGGENSIRIEDSRIANANIRRTGSPVRVLASSHTTIAKSNLGDKSILETYSLSGGLFGKGFESVTIDRNADSTLRGNFPLVNINGKSNVTVQSGTVEKLEISSSATDSTIKVESRARINTATSDARVAFSGDGYIDELNARASGITYSKKPGRIYTSNGANQPSEDSNANLEVQVSPKDKETNVSRNKDIELTFKDPVLTSSGREITESYVKSAIQLRKDRRSGSSVDFNVSISRNKKNVTLDPRSSFDDDTTYYLIIGDREFQYENGTKIREQVTTFYTGKDSKVGDVTFYPRNGATRVSRTVDPTISFDDPIELRSGSSITSSRLKDWITFKKDSSSGRNVSFTASINSARTRITIDPDERLEDGQKYYLSISSSGFRYTKNSRSVTGGSVTWTVGESSSGPRITFTPSNNSTNVAPATDITIRFDKQVYRSTSRDSLTDSYIKDYITIRHIEGSKNVDYTVKSRSTSSSSTIIVLDPTSNLLEGNTYEVYVPSRFYDYNKDSNPSSSARFKITGSINLSYLNDAISKAEEARKDIKIAESANQVLTSQKFVTQSVWNTFDNAIKTAVNAKTTSISTNIAQLAADRLVTATTAFKNEIKPGTKEKLNDSSFLSAITEAKALLADTQRSSDGLDCPPEKKWAAPTDYDAFKSQIEQAENRAKTPENYTDSTLLQYERDMKSATYEFKGKRKDGMKPDKTELTGKIREARNLNAETELSTDGSDIQSGKYWATDAAKTALTNAITSADAVNNDDKAHKETVDTEVEKLKQAIDTFKSARQQK